MNRLIEKSSGISVLIVKYTILKKIDFLYILHVRLNKYSFNHNIFLYISSIYMIVEVPVYTEEEIKMWTAVE